MKWLISLETDNDPIAACRLMNIFRRKGLKIAALTLAAQPASFSMMVLVEAPEADAEHIFNFLRRTDGVQGVTYYQHEPSQDATFIFVESAEDSENLKRIQGAFPECKVIFASHGKYLVEVPSGASPGTQIPGLGAPGFLPLSRVRASQQHRQMELVGATLR